MRVQVFGDQVILDIYGAGKRPVLSGLGDQLDALLDRPIKLQMFIVPSEKEEYVPMLE